MVDLGRSAIQVALLGQVGRHTGCRPVRHASGVQIAAHLQQVGTYRVQPMVLGEFLIIGDGF